MRAGRLLAVLVLVFLVLSAVPVQGQHDAHKTFDQEDNTITIVDPPQDVGAFVAPKQNPAPQNASCPVSGTCPGNFDHIDITKVVFGEETVSDFKITLQLKSLTNSNPAGFPSRSVQFSYGRINWRVTWSACQGGGSTQPQPNQGCLSFGQGGFGTRNAKQFTVEVKTAENSIVFPIQKIWLYDESRVSARFGTLLTNISATGYHFYAGVPFIPGGDPTGGVAAIDRAPNTGVWIDPFKMIRGANSNGHLALHAPAPIRVSNGEATTIVYKVDVYNHHVEPLTVQLDADKLPDGWVARVPAAIKVPAQSTLSVPVILSVPFTHLHGETYTFHVRGAALEDENSYGDTQLGVYWTEIPQPSGHHETADGGTFFHMGVVPNDRTIDQLESVIPTYQMWMNGVEIDPDPSVKDQNIPSGFNEYFGCLFAGGGQVPPPVPTCQVPPSFTASWFFPLSPALLMGLDFDLTKVGLMDLEILPDLPAQQAEVYASLVYCDPGAATSGTGLCALNQTSIGGASCPRGYSQTIASGKAGRALTQGVPAPFSIDLTVNPAFDFMVYRPGINIGMCVKLVTPTPSNLFGSEPRPEFVTKKARLRLPLVEYHDPIDQAFENVGVVGLASHSPFEKHVNPGRSTVFQFDLTSNATQTRSIALEVQGVHGDWAQIVGPVDVSMPAGGKHPFELIVSVPDEAVAEERAELFLLAQDRADPSVVAVTRLRATVVDASVHDIPDEQPQAGSAKSEGGIPGFEAVVLAVALALPLLVRRRVP